MERRCIATGRVLPRARLIRFVVAPDGTVVPDLEARLPGRGLWVSAERRALDKAVAKKLFGKAAGRSVQVPDDLAHRTTHLLEERCLRVIGMARRAGLVAAGFEAVRAWLADGQAAVLLVAADAGPNGRAKLERMSAARALPVVAEFSAAGLGRALGRDIVVHAGLAGGGLAQLFLTELQRFRDLRGPAAGSAAVE